MKVLVAMSGGVDSTVAAYLLKKSGHEVIGVNFAFALDFVETNELLDISKSLDIKIIFRDYQNEFKEKIIASFVNDYKNGITPNPCALCNGIMKFEKLLQVMKEENCDMIATGHYANIATIAGANVRGALVGANVRGAFVGASIASPQVRYCIKKSKNLQKDQSYMLYRLTEDQLSHIIFPLSDMDKNEVRKIALELGLKVAEKKDSQDVCFIKDIDYKEFIKRYEFGDDYREQIATGKLKEDDITSKKYFSKGEFVDINGKVLGYHDGIINYTCGQRKGLNIAFGERKFVVSIDVDKNQVILGSNDDLMSTDFSIHDVVFSGISKEALISDNSAIYIAKLRYRHDGTECKVVVIDESNKRDLVLKCHLQSPVRAITRGQSAVFYDKDGNIMFGGRII